MNENEIIEKYLNGEIDDETFLEMMEEVVNDDSIGLEEK